MVARDIVVIGASRGGLDALRVIASDLPFGFPAAVLVVLHTAQHSPRLLADIVGRQTPLEVSYAAEDDAIEHGHIYFAPPAYHLIVVAPGNLHLGSGPKERFSRPAADPLFRSAANVFGPRVVGVVLTGGDGDGTRGLAAIMAAGGLGVVQEPETAIDPSMPLSALDGRCPNYCVPLNDIATLLTRLVNGPPSTGRTRDDLISGAPSSASG